MIKGVLPSPGGLAIGDPAKAHAAGTALQNLRDNTSGSSAAEYALIIALAGFMGAAATTFGSDLKGVFSNFSMQIAESSPSCSYRDVSSFDHGKPRDR